MGDLEYSMVDPKVLACPELQIKHDMIILQEMLTQLKQLEVNIETQHTEVKKIELQRDVLRKKITDKRETLRKVNPKIMDAEIIDNSK